MDKQSVEIFSHDAPGYKPLVYYEGWRVALLNYDRDKFSREHLSYLERHNNTDEVFILLKGSCTLYIGNGVSKNDIGTVEALKMESGKLYNIKKGVWHNLSGSADMSLAIIENAETSKNTSDYYAISPEILPSF
jgi:mannose-6-phosphate isomerase-like protein (cupin superfamily)